MKDELKKRLQTLKSEFETGQKRLKALEAEQASIHKVLLRISGAIQVLEEELERLEAEGENTGEEQ